MWGSGPYAGCPKGGYIQGQMQDTAGGLEDVVSIPVRSGENVIFQSIYSLDFLFYHHCLINVLL